MSTKHQQRRFSKEETIRYKQFLRDKKKKQFDELYAIVQPQISTLKEVIAEKTLHVRQIVVEEEKKCQEIIRAKTAEDYQIIEQFKQELDTQLKQLQKVCDHDYQGPPCAPRIMYRFGADTRGCIQTHTQLSECKYCDKPFQYYR